MGKKLFNHIYVSPDETERLGIRELKVIESSDDEGVFRAVHERYFSNEKVQCPTCGAKNTCVSKIVTRTLKDILPHVDDQNMRVIDLVYMQRYYRCKDCQSRVFPEESTFAERGCRYTNRLSDILANGTLTHSYGKVCKHYGVPASKTSVGMIMRRIFRQQLEGLPPLKTPITLSVVIVQYCSNYYPVVLNVTDSSVFFIDILCESSEAAYLAFFRQLDAKEVRRVIIDADEQLVNAANSAFPTAEIVMSDECILRHIRAAFADVIIEEGKHSGIPYRVATLSKQKKYLMAGEKKRVRRALDSRPRLRAAYVAYQELLARLDSSQWSPDTIIDWIRDLPDYLADETTEGSSLEPLIEFDIVGDILAIYRPLLDKYLRMDRRPSAQYESTVVGISDAIQMTPSCIFDVLRARMTLNCTQATIEENGQVFRLGITAETLIETMKDLAATMKKEREDNDIEPENTRGWN